MQPKLLFFIGKGGVGKSTMSATTALHLSKSSEKTLLVSMDPAHNQRDIFEEVFSETPRCINPCLAVKEVDTDYWIRKYLKETQKTIKMTYSYESAFNLEGHFNILQFSPGLEEYALLLAFESIVQASQDNTRIVFDMAPTALSLRFFSLPFITLVWLEELLKLRDKIIDKKEIISKIKIGKKMVETDKIRVRLDALISRYQQVSSLFRSPQTHINLVMNDDRMSFSEAVRIKEKLLEIGMHIDSVLINKGIYGDLPDEMATAFKEQRTTVFPLAADRLTGLLSIEAYIKTNDDLFRDLVNSSTNYSAERRNDEKKWNTPNSETKTCTVCI
jgi:arsenite-transporting ATPase